MFSGLVFKQSDRPARASSLSLASYTAAAAAVEQFQHLPVAAARSSEVRPGLMNPKAFLLLKSLMSTDSRQLRPCRPTHRANDSSSSPASSSSSLLVVVLIIITY